jgi:Ca2+-dependent lipid-binding protein
MSGEEYRRAQDISAPPDPVQEGATSDVPIRSEKTSILFYKTPSVSYEPMFEALETRGNVLAAGIFFGIIVFGRMFGGRLLGLIPLAICVSSGVFLWIKDLIRRGRDQEWSSEQQRGETATANLIPESVEWMNTALGIVWGLVNPEMFSGVADTYGACSLNYYAAANMGTVSRMSWPHQSQESSNTSALPTYPRVATPSVFST